MEKHDRAELFVQAFTEHFDDAAANEELVSLNLLRKAMKIAFIEGWNQRGKVELHSRYKDLIKETTGITIEGEP